jgi:hypothetical protein
MIIADTHLLGIRNGHWLDKLRREWQMYRSFQTAITLLSPKAVFFLGDLFDEGQWSSDEEYSTYMNRFNSLFHADGVARFVIVGNHDIGFHYAIVPHRLDRFAASFAMSKAVEVVHFEGNAFVLVNSMAMESDGCRLCTDAERTVEDIARCQTNRSEECNKFHFGPTRPILMQHFPLYRESDMECEEAPDLAPSNIRSEKFRPKWECLSKESTDFLLTQLRPRAAFSGHTHFGCKKWRNEPVGLWEYTVPSFSWRNNRRPEAILLSITPEEFSVGQCYVPHEETVLYTYAFCFFFWLTYLAFTVFYGLSGRNQNVVNKYVLVPEKLS